MDKRYNKPELYPEDNHSEVAMHWDNKGRKLAATLLESLPQSRKLNVSKAVLQFIDNGDVLPEDIAEDKVAQQACNIYSLCTELGMWVSEAMSKTPLAYERENLQKAMKTAKLLEQELRQLDESYFEVTQIRRDLQSHYTKLEVYGRWNSLAAFVFSSISILHNLAQ